MRILALAMLAVFLLSGNSVAADIVFKTGNLVACDARLQFYGLSVRSSVKVKKVSSRYEEVNTPLMVDKNGYIYFAVRMDDDKADLLPANDTPNFSILYDSRVDTVWPKVEIADGVFREVGRIQ